MSIERISPNAVAVPPQLRRIEGVARWLLVLVAAAALTVAAVQLGRAAILQSLEEEAIETKPAGNDTPGRFGVAFQDIRLTVSDHEIQGRLVRASRATAPAVLIFHGNGETVSDWSDVQARLQRAGVTSLVFDYSGFGLSSGRPSVNHMREDAFAAFASLVRLAPHAAGHVLIGHSLGNAVMLDVAKNLHPAPLGLVVHAGFTSAREMAIRAGLVSNLVAFLLPDLWNNEQALSGAGPRLLVLHGEKDAVVPAAMGRRLATAAGSRSEFKSFAGLGHDDFYLQPSAAEWDPIIEFVAAVSGATMALGDTH